MCQLLLGHFSRLKSYRIMMRDVYANEKQHVNDFKMAIIMAWDTVNISTIKKLIQSMLKCIYSVINKNRDNTKY